MADITPDIGVWSSTAASNQPAGTTTIGTGLDDNLRAVQAAVRAFVEPLSSVAGTNTVTASCAGLTAYYAGERHVFVPAATNTGATTININTIGAKNVYFDGRACVGGELVAGVPAFVEYDGTQFNILSPIYTDRLTDDTSPDLAADYVTTYDNSATAFKKVLLGRIGGGVLGTEQAATSGTSIDFTGIPSWAKKVIVQFAGVSTSGTSDIIIQLGDSGGVETTGYLGSTSALAGTVTTANFTSGHGVLNGTAAATVIHGAVTFTLEDAANFTWVGVGVIATSNAAGIHVSASSKSTSAALDRVRITTGGGTDTFDAGAINILYE